MCEPDDNSDFDAVADFLGKKELEFKFYGEFGGTTVVTAEAIPLGIVIIDGVATGRFYLKKDGVIENHMHPDAEVMLDGLKYLVQEAVIVHGKIQVTIVRHV